jgi:hypothetical protein
VHFNENSERRDERPCECGTPHGQAARILLNTTAGAGGGVNREYDLFEKFPDGSVLWRCCVAGLEAAIAKLKHEADLSPNEHFARHTPTNAIVARVNVFEPEPRGSGE